MPTYLHAFSGVSVDNLQKAREFYVDTLHLILKTEEMGLTFDLPGGGSFFIYEKPDHQAASYTVLNLVVSNIDDTIHELVDSGVVMHRYENLPADQDELGVLRGKDAGYGPNIAWLLDPAGNTVAIIED